jgi:hypothetical protein
MHPLDGPKLKVNRAKEHLDRLSEAIRSFFDTRPMDFTTNFDEQNSRKIIRVSMSRDVPARISIIAGDAMYNLRSALDQTAYQLAYLSGKEPNSRCEFPISDKRPDGRKQKELMKKLEGIPADAIKMINIFQPYTRAYDVESHPLWLLDTLCNHDKHRGLTASGTLAVVTLPNIDGITSKKIDGRTVELSFPVQQENFEPMISPGIQFLAHRLGNRVSDGTLFEIYEFINQHVLPRFERFFP